MKFNWRNHLVCLIVIFCCSFTSAWACTDFRLTAKDGTVVITRSLEFAEDLQSNLLTSPRGRHFINTTDTGKTALAWDAKYGYVFLDGLNTGVAIEGMNEQGLAVEALYLPGETQYQTVTPGQEAHALSYLHFGDWLLGNFKTIAEVKAALPGVVVYAQKIPQAKDMIFPLHYSIFDSTGKGIIVEFIAGKMKIYDNQVGILTNSPTYDWHITNLRNYVNLMPTTPQPVIDNNITFYATGQGAGMHGLPGDTSPPSRFIKIAALLNTVITPNNAEETINLAQHIINNVDIPLGFVRSGKDINTSSNESTWWIVFKDLTHKIFYYRTYGDLTLRAVDLNKINLTAGAPQLKMSLLSKQYVMDVTNQLQK